MSESPRKSATQSVNESQETRRFDSDQIGATPIPRPGLVLRERYGLDSEIGRGAMGIVFRATDLELLRPVEVKILAERLSGGTTEAARSPHPYKEFTAPAAGERPAVPTAAGETPALPAASDQRS